MATMLELEPPKLELLKPRYTIREIKRFKLYKAHRPAEKLDFSEIEIDKDFQEYLDDLEVLSSQGYPAEKDSIDRYAQAWKRFQYFVKTPPENIKKDHIQGFIRKAIKHGYSPTTINNTLTIIRAFYNWRLREKPYPCPYCGGKEIRQLIINSQTTYYYCKDCDKPLNPTQGVKFPKAERRNDPTLTLADVNVILTWIPRLAKPSNVLAYESIIRIGLETAARSSELLSLGLTEEATNYVDLEASEIILRKTKGKRRILEKRPISFTTRDIIIDYAYQMKKKGKDVSKRLFTIYPQTLWIFCKSLQVNSGLDKNLYPHLLRATFATEFWRTFGSEELLKRAGGWSSDAYKFQSLFF